MAQQNFIIDATAKPETMLQEEFCNLEVELRELRLVVAKAIAAQKYTERRYIQAQSQADNWHQCAQLALQKGEDNLAREALSWWHPYQQAAMAMKKQLEQQTGAVKQLRQQLMTLEGQVAEVNTFRGLNLTRTYMAKKY